MNIVTTIDTKIPSELLSTCILNSEIPVPLVSPRNLRVGGRMSVSADEQSYNIFDPAIRPGPYPLYARFLAEGPVVRNLDLGFWMISGYETAREALLDSEQFSNGLIGIDPVQQFLPAPTMLFTDPPDHERLRTPVAQAFGPAAMRDLVLRAEAIADDLLAQIEPGAPFDVVQTLAYPLPVIMIAEMLGVPPEDRDRFKRWSDAVVGFSALGEGGGDVGDVEQRRRMVDELLVYLAAAIEKRRSEPSDDLIGRLVAANRDGEVTDDELLASCVLLLVAGNETTTHLIGNLLLALAGWPEEMARLVEHPELVPNAIEETLRFDPPVQAIPRVVMRDTEMAGQRLAGSEMVLIMNAGANRDPAQFPDPDRYDITRENAARHLAFGWGIHHCMGASLARTEGQAALRALLRHGRSVRLADPDAPLEYGPNFFLRGLSTLQVIIDR